MENRYVVGMPGNDQKFLAKFRAKKEFDKFANQMLLGRKHFRQWLWLLVFGDETVFTQLSAIREFLHHNPDEYVWFATNVQGLFDLLSDDNHTEGRELDMKFVKKSKIHSYISFLSPDLQKCAEIFFKSEGWIK